MQGIFDTGHIQTGVFKVSSRVRCVKMKHLCYRCPASE